MVHFNIYGVAFPDTPKERGRLRKALVSLPCPVCHAQAGRGCNKMKPGVVHMGRLPDGFDTVDAMNGKYEEAEHGG